MVLNCHLAAFCAVHLDFKKWPNDNLILFVCEAVFSLVIIAIRSYETG